MWLPTWHCFVHPVVLVITQETCVGNLKSAWHFKVKPLIWSYFDHFYLFTKTCFEKVSAFEFINWSFRAKSANGSVTSSDALSNDNCHMSKWQKWTNCTAPKETDWKTVCWQDMPVIWITYGHIVHLFLKVPFCVTISQDAMAKQNVHLTGSCVPKPHFGQMAKWLSAIRFL